MPAPIASPNSTGPEIVLSIRSLPKTLRRKANGIKPSKEIRKASQFFFNLWYKKLCAKYPETMLAAKPKKKTIVARVPIKEKECFVFIKLSI